MSLIRTLPRNQGVVPISGTLWVWGGGSGRSVPSKFPLPPPRCLPPPRYPWEPKLSAFPLRLARPVPRPPRAAVRRRPLRPHSVLAAADRLFRREALSAVQERGSPAFRGPRSPRAGAGPRRPGRALRLRPPSVFGFAARHSKRRSTQTPGPRGGEAGDQKLQACRQVGGRRLPEGATRRRRVSQLCPRASGLEGAGAPRLLARQCPHYTGEDAEVRRQSWEPELKPQVPQPSPTQARPTPRPTDTHRAHREVPRRRRRVRVPGPRPKVGLRRTPGSARSRSGAGGRTKHTLCLHHLRATLPALGDSYAPPPGRPSQ